MADSSTPTVLLIHGAFADASGWAGVITDLVGSGLSVSAPANPLRGASDNAYISGLAAQVDGPVLLVGHSYAGNVISAQQPDNVVGLVFVDGFAPEAGETLLDINGRYPDTNLGPALRTQTFPVDGGEPGTEFFLDVDLYHAGFCADVSSELAAVLARTQRPAAAEAFGTPAGPPSWKSLPSWAVFGTGDLMINNDALRDMAARADSPLTEVPGASHVGFVANPEPYAEVIRTAVKATT
jgi:pimeloyl-ACP methyl ester carboxylesterase